MTFQDMKEQAKERAEIIDAIERIAFHRYDTGGQNAAIEYLDGICDKWKTRPDVGPVIKGLREGFSVII